ncbi:hypothetical protein ACSQ67_003959 [Phaseolus vulgaris]
MGCLGCLLGCDWFRILYATDVLRFEKGKFVCAAEEEMNWIQRKIYLYNVTFGLYMLDWWERCTFNILVIVLMCFVLRYATRFFKR